MKCEQLWIRILAAVLAILTAAVTVNLLGMLPSSGSGAPATAKHRYVYLAPSGEEDYFVEIAEGICQADRESGTDTLLIRYDGGKEDVAACMEDAVFAEADGVIVKGAQEISGAVAAVEENGIPVVFYDVDVPGSGRSAYVGIDNYKAGEAAMQALADAIEQKGTVLLALRSSESESQKLRLQGCLDAAEKYPQICIADTIENGGNELSYKEKLLELLKSGENVNAILCMDGISADTTGKILVDSGLNETVAVGVFDLTEATRKYLEEGVYSFIMMQDAWQIGSEAVFWLNAYLDGTDTGQEMGDRVFLDTLCVTQEELDRYDRKEREELEWDVY